jgi:molybdopterin/thiamine biosynthesis adenylyltransferase/rhodanese-related sulfurtransferase
MQRNNPYERYHRQIILKNFGIEAQQKLSGAKVLVIGAGGLGCPALQYLAAAGIGVIGIVDDDLVEISNLHRQPIYAMDDLGKFKAVVAASFLKRVNPEILINSYVQRLNSLNAIEIISGYDMIIDGTDNFASKYMINDACILLGKIFIYGAVSQYEGQVAVFNFYQKGSESAIHYRDIFPEPPAGDEVLTCAEAGVLGVLPGIIGTMQAAEAIKLITGIGEPLINKLYTFNLLNNQSYQFELAKRKDSDALVPLTIEAFQQTDYVWLCENNNQSFDISIDDFETLLAKGDADIIDVREPGELPGVSEFSSIQIPLSQLEKKFDNSSGSTVVFFCQSGIRSARAAQWVNEKYGKSITVYSLKGGILHYKKQKQEERI